ncbi:MAG: hypothetical protein IT162_13895 [Bryobacterales bacterium]|nr:hypothetical protein [Bryobacterales bacterium]
MITALFALFALGLTLFAVRAAAVWLRFGRATRTGADPLLDRLLPDYDIAERHHIRIAAPADTVFAAACAVDLDDSPVVRAITRGRELLLGTRTDPHAPPLPRGMLAGMKARGWGVLAELPQREIVMGAVTQPWQANVVFHALPPEEFAVFYAPGYVKIAWTLRADPDGDGDAVFRTETRACACGGEARRLFRNYWALLSAGIVLIRWETLRMLKRAAEQKNPPEPVGAGGR